MRCSACNALECSLVLRHTDPDHWRIWWPAPIKTQLPADRRGHAKYPQLNRREADSIALVRASGKFSEKPQPVNLNELGHCTWCETKLRLNKPPVCPRCQPNPPPGDPSPCQLCSGTGLLRGARTFADIIDRVCAQVTTPYVSQ